MMVACIAVFSPGIAFSQQNRAQDLNVGVTRSERLRRTPLRMTVQGQSLDQVVRQVAMLDDSTPTWNVHFHRSVDPTRVVNFDGDGPNASNVLVRLVESLGLAIFPIPGVYLIGPAEWIDATLSDLGALPPRGADNIAVAWPDGTTAAQILQALVDAPSLAATSTATPQMVDPNEQRSAFRQGWFPHDIWRSGRFDGVDRAMAVTVILSNYNVTLNGSAAKRVTSLDLNLDKPKPPTWIQHRDASRAASAFSLVYPLADQTDAAEFISEIRQLDRAVLVQRRRYQVSIRSRSSTHRQALAFWWGQPTNAESRRRQPGSRSAPEPVFDLELINKPALEVLRQLAAKDGRQLRLTGELAEAGESRIHLDVTGKTLRELAELVAEQSGLTLVWKPRELMVVLTGERDSVEP
ncbi:MAG: hypothetical protein AAF670_10560 [Planctomycetota bacterium]